MWEFPAVRPSNEIMRRAVRHGRDNMLPRSFSCSTTVPVNPLQLTRSFFARLPRFTPQWICVGLLTSCSASSCQRAGAAPAALYMHVGSPQIEQYVSWQHDFVFEDSAASSDITAFFDERPGFIVADEGQTEIRAYTDKAQLLWSAGHKGPGPAEFRDLRAAVRTADGHVIALDDAGKIVVYDSAGGFVRSKDTGLGPAYSLLLINDSTVLISGRRSVDPRNPDQPLLHLWDLRRDTIVKSFFSIPPHDHRLEEGYRYSGWATAAVLNGDTLGVVFPLADTLYRFLEDGTPVDKHRLSLRNFTRMRDPAPTNASPQETVAWRNSYTRLSDIFAAPDHSIYIQYFNMEGLEPIFGLARYTLRDDKLQKSFEVGEAPRLLGISPRDNALYFLHPDDDPERVTWSVGRYSR